MPRKLIQIDNVTGDFEETSGNDTILAQGIENPTGQVIFSDIVGPTSLDELRQGAAGAQKSEVSGQALSALLVVRKSSDGRVYYMSSADTSHTNVYGITKTSAAGAGLAITVVLGGEFTDPSWNWIPDKVIYLGINGVLTQTSPNTGFSCIIGVAITATTIFVKLNEPIFL